MAKATVSVTGTDRAIRSASEIIKRLEGRNQVLVGVQKASGAYEDGAQIAVIAAANHFGATIKTKGGVSYGYRTEKEAIAGQVRFMEAGKGFMELGKTSAGVTKIPARPFLDVAISKNKARYSKIFKNLIPKVIDEKMTAEQMLNSVGEAASSDVQDYLTELRDPPNATSTVSKKGSDNPLIDTGFLKQSIRHEIARDIVTEGV